MKGVGSLGRGGGGFGSSDRVGGEVDGPAGSFEGLDVVVPRGAVFGRFVGEVGRGEGVGVEELGVKGAKLGWG
jgi:hypothetical protein